MRASAVGKAQTGFVRYKPCYFEVALPSNFKLERMFADGCDYIVKLPDSTCYIEFHSSERGRFEANGIDDFYKCRDIPQSVHSDSILPRLLEGNRLIILTGGFLIIIMMRIMQR